MNIRAQVARLLERCVNWSGYGITCIYRVWLAGLSRRPLPMPARMVGKGRWDKSGLAT